MLFDRHAIPEIRIDYFFNPKYNIGTNKSRKEVFEGNGTKGLDIFYHGHFLAYFKYFIFGPALPSTLIDEFCTKLDEDNLPANINQRHFAILFFIIDTIRHRSAPRGITWRKFDVPRYPADNSLS